MAISGPIALYSNVPIHPEYYQPRMFRISDIVRGLTTIVVAVVPVDYVIGQQVRILIPDGYGIPQINKMTAFVVSFPTPDSVELQIDSRGFDAFINVNFPQFPQILAIGDVNTGPQNLTNKNMTTFIPGSFINISPQ